MFAATNESSSVHPRVCGELVGAADDAMWAGRFIPACAGNSPSKWAWRA